MKSRKKKARKGRTTRGMDPAKRKEFLKKKWLYCLDGLALYADAQCPIEEREPLFRMGWGIGRQIISQYVVEMLLQIRLQERGVTGTESHNLAKLYKMLPESEKSRVETTYMELLNLEVKSTWDVYKTVASFLDFLGENPIKNTRYPWQPPSPQQRGVTLYSPNIYRALIYALFIALHDYPIRDPIVKRYDTEFVSFEESRKDR